MHTRVFFTQDTDQVNVAPLCWAIGVLITVHFIEVIVPHFNVVVTERDPIRNPFREEENETGTPDGFVAFTNEILRVGDFAVLPLTPKAHQPPASPPMG